MNNSLELTKPDGDWVYLLSFLPEGWEEQAWELGALKRTREFSDAAILLRILLIHLVDGCSLRETAARAKIGGIVKVNDTSLLRRLNSSGEWFRWMAVELMKNWIAPGEGVLNVEICKKVRIVDATCISEPGSTGTNWRVHYSIDLPDLRCHQLLVSDQKTGESFRNFMAEPDCLFIGDRGYSHRAGIAHVINGGGQVIVRLNTGSLPLNDRISGKSFDVLEKARSLKPKQIGDWKVDFEYDGKRINGRVCAIKKSKIAAEKAQKDILRESAKKQKEVKPETLEVAEYIFVLTTLDSEKISAETVLETYRGRWQIEIAFKRLKSLLEVGHVPKKDPVGAKSWIHGKMLCAILIEKLIEAGESFFPWGYPLVRN
jgi:hypothetical protein